MISINLFIPYEQRGEIDSMESETFVIVHNAKYRATLQRFYIIETTEEQYTFLRLKYGRENVWQR